MEYVETLYYLHNIPISKTVLKFKKYFKNQVT